MLAIWPTSIRLQYDGDTSSFSQAAQGGEKMMVGQRRSIQGRLDVREALDGTRRSYSELKSSSYFSNPVNEFSLTYDIRSIDGGFSVGSTVKRLKEKVNNRRPERK
jgi:hypothetical protein